MKCFKMFSLLFASLAMLAMVGCGGGGGSSSPATQNPTLNVSIPGGPFQQTTASFRAVQIADELVVKVEAYEKGVKKSSGIEDRKATYNKKTNKYECSITVLPGVEYRLIAYLNDKPVLSNQIAASKVQNNATITIDATTTLKTQVYDKWKDSSSNKSFSNFVKNCEKKGINIDKAEDISSLSGVSTTDFETELKKVANKDVNAKLPEVNTVDVSKIGTEDLETSGDKPTPPSYPDETIKMLATADGWLEAAADADSKLTGLSYVVNLLYSTEDGVTYKNRKEVANYIIKYDPYGGSHPYGLYKDGSYAGPNYKFEYLKDSKKFKYIFLNSESGVETTSEYKIEKLVKDNITYYRAINTDSSKKDVYYFKLASADGYDEEGLTSEFINLNWKSLPSLDDLGSVEGFKGTDYVYDGHFTALKDNDVVKIVAESVLDKNVRKWTVIAENERDNYKFIDNFYFMHIDNSEFNAKMYCSIFFSEVGGRNLSWYSAVKDSSNYIFFKVTDGVADVVYSATQHDYPQNLATLQVYVAKDDAGHIYAKLIDKASNKSRILRIYSK